MFTITIPLDDKCRHVGATSVAPSISLATVRHGVCTEAVQISGPATALMAINALKEVAGFAGFVDVTA